MGLMQDGHMGGRCVRVLVAVLLAAPVIAGCTVGASSEKASGVRLASSEAAEESAIEVPRQAWLDHSWLGQSVMVWPESPTARAFCQYQALNTAAAVDLLEAVEWPADVVEPMAFYLVPVRKIAAAYGRCASLPKEDAEAAFCNTGKWGIRPDGTYQSDDEWHSSQRAAYRINRLLGIDPPTTLGMPANSISSPCRQ